MSEQYARTVSHRGPWLNSLLLAHSRALEAGGTESVAQLTAQSRKGQLIALDTPGPARGYAVVDNDSSTVQLHVVDGSSEEAYHAIFATIADVSAENVVIAGSQVGPEVFKALAELGSEYGIFVDDDRTQGDKSDDSDESADNEVAKSDGPDQTDDSGQEPKAIPASSPYAKMRRPQLEAIAKERSVFIPKKIDDLRRALIDSDDTSEPYDD